MAKRVSRKLLLGLGSTLTFGTIGVVGGFGIKSIVDLTSNNQINPFSIKALAESQFSNAPDYNVATKDMFIDPSNLKRFHFGNTLIGQTVTPYGWLGVFDDPYKGAIASTRIALTGWNGEILWVNEPTDTEPGLDDRNYNVYDMEYDFKNDLIFVLRTWSSNGFLNDRDETFPPIRLDILDAKTGKAYNRSSIKWQTAANTHVLKKWQEKALNGWSEGSRTWLGLKNSGYLNWKNQQNRDQSKNLYQLDLASSSDQKNLLLTWMPDFMRLTKNFGSTNASSISLKDFIQIWRSVAVSWIMLPENIKNNSAAEYSVYFDLLLSDEINIPDDKILKVLVNGEWKPADQFYLIANPFFTVGKDNSNGAKPFFIMHILFADKNGNVYHKIIGWDEVASRSNANGVLYKKSVYDKTQRIDWREKTNFSDGSGILVESGKNGSIPSWVNRDKYVSREVINANTRINKNMFNNNSILFAHPYGAATFLNKRYPIFNVAQMYVEPLTGFFYGIKDSGKDEKKVPRQFYFGRDIEKNNKEIAHYPGANPGGKGAKNNINQTYHRLISVSPFDNTFIYAERPNIKNSFFEQGANDSIKDWAGFFIGKAFRNSNDVVRPFFVWNSNSPSAGSLSNLINSSMTSFEKLYEDGFTFDLRSFQTSGSKIGLNLYFNQNGNPNGTANPNGFKSRKIGMMPDVFTKIDNGNLNGNELWIGNGKLALQQTLKNPTQFYNFTGAKIETNSFSTLIHSRANLDKWYSRTLFNNINPSNLLTGNSLLNNSSSENTRAVASVFDKKLTGNDFESTGNAKKSIDMVSNWETNSAGYNRLLVQRPQIKVRSESVPNNLPIETIYPFTNDSFLSQNIWINSNDRNRLIFKTTENLSSASYQIFSSWKEQVRMKSIGSITNNLSAFENPDFKMSASWFDIRKNADSNPFGKFNNNLALSNNKRPLRMLLQISKPTGTMPVWFNKINQSLFKKYPLAKDVVNGETSFEEILKQFIEEKTRKIDLSENNNTAAVGLGNLRIDAFLDINPSVISTSDFKIYTNGNKRMVVQNNTGLRIIYEDKYTEQWHQIYDQSQIKYNQFSRGGFGEAVRNAVQTSWDPKTTPSTTTKLKVSVNAEHFQNNLVRKSNTEKKIFTFERDNSNNLLIIPTDAQWLRSRLLNFQRLINMRPIFEYWTDESKTWKTLTTLNDDWFETNWPANQNNFTLRASTVTETITKLRLKLKPNDKITANDPNSFVELNGYVESESSPGNKFISDPQEIGVQKIDVNNAWFNQVTLQNSSSLLQNINGSDFEKFETNIFNNSNAIKKNPALRKKVKLMYKWNGENTELDKNGIANLIQERLRNFGSTDQGVFALWNGTTGFKIQAIFTTVDDSVSFVVNNNDATESQLKGDVKSDIKNEINLGTYINELTSNPINALTGNTAGEFSGTSIQFPSKSGEPGTAQFAGKTYEQIKEILNKVDVSIQYKQWENGKWSSWINDLNQVTKYDPTNPEIKIGFKINSLGKSWNIKLKNNSSEITNDTDFTLKLNLPKLVKLPSENEITKLINQFNNKNVFGKNTYDLSVNETSLNAAKTEIINILKTTSANNNNVSGYDGLEKYIDLQFQLGNSQWYSAIELKKWLSQSSIDQENNALKMKIIMTENTSFILEEQLKMKEFELLNDGNKVIKKYIHGTKIEPELNKITASGLSTSITYTYPPEIKKIISGSKQGLKLQYTYNSNLDVKDATSNWVDVENANLPTSNIPPTVKKIYVRVSVTDPSLYDYGPELDGTKIKGVVDLENLRDQINVDSSWLNLPFPKNQTINLKDINTQAIDEFESRVFNSIQSLTPEQKDKLLIKYYFNNNNNTQLDKNDLLNEISKYKNSGTFDILQLWNTHQGVKISATFVKKDSGGNYDLIWANNNRIQNLDTSKVVTTIDLTSLVTWLEQIKVNVVKNGQTITSLIFPTITTEASNPFNGKEWSKTEDALESLAIKVQYQEVASNVDSNKWNETIESIKNHDNRSQFKIRFVLEKSKGKNLIVKIKNGQELIGTDSSDQPSQPVTVNLAIPKVIQIDGAAVEKFRNSNPFSGNTKKIKVDENSLNNLINDIKTSSLNSQIPSIASAPLQVKFRFGTTEEFRELNEWIKYLKDMNTDQSTNKIQIKFNIAETGSNEWAIDNPNGFYTIEPNNVPIYVHDQGIHENIKMNTTVSGTNDALEIRFPSGDGFYIDDNNEIKGSKGLGLKLQFSLDPNDDVGDNSKWTDQRPTKVPPGTNSFFIRIIPVNNNYVYEKQVENDYRKIQIIFTVIQKIRVEKSWLNEFKLGDENNTNTKIEITQLSLDKIKKWIAKIQDKIRIENKVSEAISKKINIKFSFKNENDLDAEGLFNKINSELKNFNGPDLGIVQLWNKVRGDKINAKFVAEDQTILIQDSTGNTANLLDDLWTDNIYTKVNLSNYVQVLETEFTNVVRSSSLGQGQMNSFTPPNMTEGNMQFGGKTYNQISSRLSDLNIKILFKDPNGTWVEKDSLKTYDPQTALLPLAFVNNSDSNIYLEIRNSQSANSTINPGQDNKANPINLKLQVPKQFNIDPQIVSNYQNDHGLSGDTKNIKLDKSKLNNLINNLITHNNITGNDSVVQVLFSLNSETPFVEFDELQKILFEKNEDQTSNRILIKFKIVDNQRDKWFIENEDKEYSVLDNGNKILKFFINDAGIYQDLQQTQFNGTNENLQWIFQSGINVDENSGKLRKNLGGKVYGVGLKLAYSFDKTDWKNQQPKSYDPTKKEVFIKIEFEEEDKYVYDNLNKIITLRLNLPVNINLENEWLNQSLFSESSKSIDEFIKNANTIFRDYESKVFTTAKNNGIDETLHDKFAIRYTFDGNNDLTKDQLVQKLISYKSDKSNTNTFGILQLWNQNNGIKIEANFVDANPDDNFIIQNNSTGSITLNTSKVETTINFSNVVKWITATTMKVPIEEGNTANSIKKINIPDTKGINDPYFANRSWDNIQETLDNFGIQIEYKPDGIIDAPWGQLNAIQTYEPTSGQIQFRLKFKNNQYTNIKLLILDQELDGKNQGTSNEYKFKLDVKLNVIVDSVKIQQFVQSAAISGDTKNIEITKGAEQTLIDTIKEQNALTNPEFKKVNLKVQYYLGSESDQSIKWKEWTSFKSNLASQTIDQKSNRVIFRLAIDESQNNIFSVANTTYVLHDDRNSPENWTVKYFINKGKLEDSASKITVSGTSSLVKWNYDSFGANNVVKETQADGSNKIFIKNIHGQKILQVFFSTKENINYSDPESDILTDITTKWVSLEPNKFLDDWNVSKLYVKLMPLTGYIYESKEEGQAASHLINLANLKLEIKVDPENLKVPLNLSGGKTYLHEIVVDDIRNFVNKAIDTIKINKEKVDVQFKFKGKNNLNSESLFIEIQKALNINNGIAKNIVQLWNGNSGEKIEAQFILKNDAKNQYTLIDSVDNNLDANRFVLVETSQIKTLINLIKIVEDLSKLKIDVLLPNQNKYDLTPLEQLIMPEIPGGNLSELQGLTWKQFEQKLAAFGVAVEARPKVKDGATPEQWTSISNVNKYDSNLLLLELRFKINGQNGKNIVLSVKNEADVEPSTGDNDLPIFEMNLKAPAKVELDEQLISTFTQQDIFGGNTKKLDIISLTPETNLIQAIINQNISNNADIYSQLNGRLEIQYYLGKDAKQANITWRSAQELKDFLLNEKQDQITNKIWFRFNIKGTNNVNDQIFQVDQTPRILIDENISSSAKIKIYINETGFSADIQKLKAIGSTDQFEVKGLKEWEAIVPKGLEIGYSKENDPDETKDNLWNKNIPTQLSSDKKLWVRFKVKDGYVYENAKENNDRYSNKHQINTDGIKVIIKLKTEWLEKIAISGNTKNASLDENAVLDAIRAENVLPTDQPNLIELQYNIKGTDDWLNKDAFQKKLIELNGAKDKTNFILKREDLQVRFNIRSTNKNNNYGLSINDQIVDDNNRDQFNISIVDQNRNSNFEGYINLDHLQDFIVDNFKIIGSTTEPKLIISKREKLNQLFMPYASDSLFDIQFSTIKNNNNWVWENDKSILKNNGQLIDEDGLINQGVTIGADKHFAIRFITKNPKYKVYVKNTEEPNGHILDISNNVKITVEIINPFTVKNKTLAVWTRELNGTKNTGKYFQGEGGFKIGVANINTFAVEDKGQQSAQEFLKTTSDLTDPERAALELVFHVFDRNPTEQEMDRVKRAINDYGDSTWRSFDSIKETNSDWSQNLKLKVGDSVAVALRIKESYANQENPFILKGDDYSMILPVMKDSNGATVKPGRLSGYKVKTDLIDIQKGNVIVANMISSQLPPLDGWTELQRVSLQSDELDNYLGVDLKVQVYTEFHEKNNHILFSGNNTKLVKRTTSQENSNVEDKGNYKDEANQDIVDKDGVHVKIYKDKTTKRLSAPKKNASVTKEKLMTNLGGGSFRFDPDADSYERGRLSLFRNQDVDLLVVANKGEGTEELPDFYLDKEDKTISLREQISPQIKFPVENEKKISYAWNYEQFAPDQIEYKSTNNNPNPEDGSAQISTIYKLIKKEGTSSDVEEITGNSPDEAFKKIEQKLKDDFDGQLRFETVYQTNKGSQTISKDSNIYNFKNLSNKDRIVVKIVAVEEDLFYVSEDQPLVINVNGLTEKAPNKNRLQYLRVKQGGLINGQGSFKVLVSNPENDNEDDQSILNGWKFLIRVWDKDKDEKGNWQVKIPWSDDPARIKGLANGDRVEWKLVSSDGNPVKDAYYNTIALDHDQKPNGEIDYKFAEVNYPNGQTAYKVVKDGIGAYPQNDDQYPENSGFVISGLQPTFEVFKIGQEAFELVLKQLNPTYVGFNNQGTINFNDQYLEGDYWVNTKGEVYLKDQSQAKLSNEIEELAEIPIKEFIDNITFFTEDPILVPYQNGFKFSGNDININNHLANGNHVWAQFNMIGFNENEPNSAGSSNGNISSITLQLADVSGLKNTSDPMSPFWYVLIALAGIVTLGTSSIIAYFVARNKKLKGKN